MAAPPHGHWPNYFYPHAAGVPGGVWEDRPEAVDPQEQEQEQEQGALEPEAGFRRISDARRPPGWWRP